MNEQQESSLEQPVVDSPVVEPSQSTSGSSDQTKESSSPLPGTQALPSLPGARDFHRQQAARLADTLRRVAQDPSDLLGPSDQSGPEDPKEKLAKLEKQAHEVLKEIQATKVDVVRVDLLAMMAQLDLKDLLALKVLLTTKNWRSKLASTSGLRLTSLTTEEK